MPESYKFLVQAVATGLLGFAVWFLQRIAVSNFTLTEQVAVLVERSNSQGREIKQHDIRLSRIEERKRRAP